MPRGKYTNHKGKHRQFTNPEEIEEQMKRKEKERKWREERGDASSSEDEAKGKSDTVSESETSEEESEEETVKAKGVENLIHVENPNRVQKKAKKLSTLNENVKVASKPELSRREREELDRQRAQANYQRLHAEGKTEEARADLARLAIIKQQRADAAKRREEEKKLKEAAKQTKTAQVQKALGKKTT
ncbi:28 kDa heat- and acid-stable phosphoprotein-like [Zootermopsis nevadensis]|uniref:28 kDa heat-and acid-stable phosphoprotein n=1 Tax=Zootermopsis nevadensis TaxID=136037 RepID=A0A067R244_ZOONE|nr:28 kDa heat- and acid-stable phosphoprotein-like [Zootermopsis nevadensis]KDR12967.1 28 kDa heat- and acid-stable phosphoprotein [Zootermopsis nevadensis]